MQPLRHWRQALFHRSHRGIVPLLVVVGLVCILASPLLYAVVETTLTVRALRQFDLTKAEQHAEQALPIAKAISFITAGKSADIEAWKTALTLPQDLKPLLEEASAASQSVSDTGSSFSLEQVQPDVHKLLDDATTLQQDIDQSSWVKHVLRPSEKERLSLGVRALTDLEKVISQLSIGKQTWLVLFQNSDELRATGGFAGSYALVTFNQGKPEEIVIEDIYDADGQFKGYIEPPHGIKEYTSSNQGLRLPDANWDPDFAQSAQTILQFFALGNKRNITGVIAINLAVGESLLKTTGPVWLPDYNQTISADNLHTVLREERDQFFPGSIQKKHILSQTFAVMRQKLGSMSAAEQFKVMQVLFNHMRTKDIQAFSISPELQTMFSRYGMIGSLELNPNITMVGTPICQSLQSITQCPIQPTLFFLVESNVGINKANQYIMRTVKLENDQTGELTATIHFTNSGPISSKTLLSETVPNLNPKIQVAENGYANYQRVLVSPTLQLVKVQANGQEVKQIDQETITDTNGQNVTQYGFLITVVPESQQDVILTFKRSNSDFQLTNTPLFILKQSGLPTTQYTIVTQQGAQEFPLITDTLVTWK